MRVFPDMADTVAEQRAATAQVKLADSAETLKESAVRQVDSADPRTVAAGGASGKASEAAD